LQAQICRLSGARLMLAVIRQRAKRRVFNGSSEMPIDIDRLTEKELIDLNNRIVERLKFLSHMRAHAEMLEFSVGDRVSFQPAGRGEVIGILTRYNRKTVTVITEEGQRWNVSPALISKVQRAPANAGGTNVIELRKK
jgi:hypothetical protein